MSLQSKKPWVLTLNLGIQRESKTITGLNFEDLYSKSVKFFNEQNLVYNPESLKNLIQRQNDHASHRGGRLSLSDAIRGATALIRYTAGKAVTKQELSRRASLCEGCPMLSAATDCMSCGGSGKVANLINTIRSAKGSEINIPASIKSKYCGVCGCSIALLIVTKFSDMKEESESHQTLRPDHCWLKKTSKHFTQE